MFAHIESKKLVAHYDPNKQLACAVVFDKVFAPQMLVDIYQCVEQLNKEGHQVQAILLDCRHIHSLAKLTAQNRNDFQSSLNPYSFAKTLPIVFIVDNLYQERKLTSYLPQFEQSFVSHIVQGYLAAFEHISSFHDWQAIPLGEYGLSTDTASLWVNSEAQFTYILYYGIVTAQTTIDVYSRMFGNMDSISIESVKAGIFDFRHVSGFDNSNTRTVQQKSGTINRSYDMSRVAVPLIVGNFHQQQMVHVAMKVSPQEERKKIVFSEDEAYTFINEFLQKINAETS